MIRTLIVDDEELARRGLELRLAAESDIQICGQCGNGREALVAVREQQPDLVFLDIQMPGLDGFETLKAMAGRHMPLVVFVTAFADYAVKAFEANALDYLLKPIDDLRLARALRRVRATLDQRQARDHRSRLLNLVCDLSGEALTLDDALRQSQPGKQPEHLSPERLAIREGRDVTYVDMNDIVCVEAAGDYLCIHAAGQTHVLRGTMKKIEKVLPKAQFARVHRSTIVNVDRVRSLRAHTNGEYFIRLENDHEVKMSRSHRDVAGRLQQQAAVP